MPGYTVTEKVDIAKRYLWPKQMKEHGLTSEHVRVHRDCFRGVVERYTREAGVRTLERKLATLCRRVAVMVATHISDSAGPGAGDGVAKADASLADGTDGIAGDLSAAGSESGAGDVVDAPPPPHMGVDFKHVDIDDEFVRKVLGPHLYELEVATMVRVVKC